MKIPKLTAFIVAAACMGCFAGCEKKDDTSASDTKSSSSAGADNVTATAPVIGGAELSADNYDSDAYLEKIKENVEKCESADKPAEIGTFGDIIEPEEGSEEAELGSYRISDRGTKLYFEESEYPKELILTLDKYFSAYPAADYTTYTSCVFPSYIDEMEKFLEKEYEYDLKTSFAQQCSKLADQMCGDYKITRIKIEPAEEYEEDGKNNIDYYLSTLDETFGEGYGDSVKADSDDIINASFYVMGEDAYGKEIMLVSGYEIFFAVKDGHYYTFG